MKEHKHIFDGELLVPYCHGCGALIVSTPPSEKKLICPICGDGFPIHNGVCMNCRDSICIEAPEPSHDTVSQTKECTKDCWPYGMCHESCPNYREEPDFIEEAISQFREKFNEVVHENPRIVKGIAPEIETFLREKLEEALNKPKHRFKDASEIAKDAARSK